MHERIHQRQPSQPTCCARPLAHGARQPLRHGGVAAAEADDTRHVAEQRSWHDFSRVRVHGEAGALQAKLTIGPADGPYEREADRVAAQVMGVPDIHTPERFRASTPRIQRLCKECKEDEDEEATPVQRKAHAEAPEASPDVQSLIGRLSGGGTPLSLSERAYFEPRFGHDFAAVRVHTDPEAARAATDLNARAFTRASHIFFGPGQYRPDSSDGRQLLAHELTHTIQQNGIQAGRGSSSADSAAAPPMVQRKPLKKPYRARVISAKDAAGETARIETCQDTNGKGCRLDVLSPGMEVTITDTFAGGLWLFAQKLPDPAVKALYGQKWIYVPAKYVERLPEPKARQKAKSRKKDDAEARLAARVARLEEAIYSRDTEKVNVLLNEGGLEDALELMERVQQGAEAKGQVSPAAYVGDDFSLDASEKPALRVALVSHTIEFARAHVSGSLRDAYDVLMAAARRMGEFAPLSVSIYLNRHGKDEVKTVVSEAGLEGIAKFGEQYERMKAAERNPLAVFQQRLKEKALEILDENESAVKKQRKALLAEGSSDKAWRRLETVVVPKAILYAQLGDVEEKLTSLVAHTTKAVAYAEAGKDDAAGVEYSYERGEPTENAWWRPNVLPTGGGGANSPPPIDEIKEELEFAQQRLASVEEQRADLKKRFPLVKALQPALLRKLSKGPASTDPAAVAKFRSRAFSDLEKQVFEVALSAIKTMREDVETDSVRLHNFKPLVDAVKSELMLAADQEAKIDAWVNEQKGREEKNRVVTTGLSLALIPVMFLPGGALIAAIVGTLAAVHGADVAGEQYTAAKAGMAGKDLTDVSLEDARWEANLALVDLIASAVDLGLALKTVAATTKAGKSIRAAEELAEEGRRTTKSAEKAGGEELAEEAAHGPKRRVRAPRRGSRIPGLPGCRAGSAHCPLDVLRDEFPKLFRRRENAEFMHYIHPSAQEVEAIEFGCSLRRDMTILTGDPMYAQYLDEVAESEFSEPFREALARARQPGVDHRIINVRGQPRAWPLEVAGDRARPWVIHHDPPLNWVKSEGSHLWHPMPEGVHDAAHRWWHQLQRKVLGRMRDAGLTVADDFDFREIL